MSTNHRHSLRAHWRMFHRQHARTLHHTARAGVFGELAYHGAEVMGAHQIIGGLAALLVVCTLARIAAGELHG